jgi:hypothetical protein
MNEGRGRVGKRSLAFTLACIIVKLKVPCMRRQVRRCALPSTLSAQLAATFHSRAHPLNHWNV